MLNGASLPSDASVRDFAKGRARYVANSVEQTLLLARDMSKLRNFKRHEVFLSLKMDLALVKILTPTHPFFYIYSFLHNKYWINHFIFFLGCSSILCH